MIVAQAFFNINLVLWLLPLKSIPLSFIFKTDRRLCQDGQRRRDAGTLDWPHGMQRGAGSLRVETNLPALAMKPLWPEAAAQKKIATTRRGEHSSVLLSPVGDLKVKRQAARDALESRAGNSRSGKVPFVDYHTVPDSAKIVVSGGSVGLPRIDKVR